MPFIDYSKQAWCRMCQRGYNFEHLRNTNICPKGHAVRLKPRHSKTNPQRVTLKRY